MHLLEAVPSAGERCLESAPAVDDHSTTTRPRAAEFFDVFSVYSYLPGVRQPVVGGERGLEARLGVRLE